MGHPYDHSYPITKPPNIKGTRNTIEFCKKKKKSMHISTLGRCVETQITCENLKKCTLARLAFSLSIKA